MNIYDPEHSPDLNAWLSLSEGDRIHLAMAPHEHSNPELLNQSLTLHASIHVVVENQLALNTQFIPETLEALMNLGITKKDMGHPYIKNQQKL
ncbi:MAG: hypothetical protein HRU06_06195 [Oceanospirillaceae bacterium]|nr:hypothetical protein [Oceanospirillaceae bacterium]